MKKLFTLFFFLTAFASAVLQAQTSCVPDATLPDTIVINPEPFVPEVPGSGIPDTACAGLYYEFIFTLHTPATFTTPFGTFPLNSIDLATEGAVLNLPASFDYVCNPPNCVFKKDSVGCLILFGTATDAEVGVYDLGLQAVVRSVIDIPITFPDANLVPGNYFLHVKPAGSANCLLINTNDPVAQGLDVAVIPNPFSDWAVFEVSSKLNGQFEFAVYDMLGHRLHKELTTLHEGDNSIRFDGSALANGMYMYSISNESGVLSGNFLINRR